VKEFLDLCELQVQLLVLLGIQLILITLKEKKKFLPVENVLLLNIEGYERIEN